MSGAWVVLGLKEGFPPVRLAFGSQAKAGRAFALLGRRGWYAELRAVEA